MQKPEITEGQIIYYVDWKKYPTIHECKITMATAHAIRFRTKLNMCSDYHPSAFFSSTCGGLGSKFFLTEEEARKKVSESMDILMKSLENSYNRALKRASKSKTNPIKKLK